MKWAVEIQQTNLEPRNLSDLLGGLNFVLIDGIDYLAFTSLDFDNCDTATEVYEMAKQLRAALTGPAKILIACPGISCSHNSRPTQRSQNWHRFLHET